jgi:hypothetical protein
MGSKERREMSETIEAQRQQLFKAAAVVDMCRYACASKFAGFDPEQMVDALRVVNDLLDDVAAALESPAEDAS